MVAHDPRQPYPPLPDQRKPLHDPLQFSRCYSMADLAGLVAESPALKRELDRRARALEESLTGWCAFVFVMGLLCGVAMTYWAAHGVHP